MGRTVLPFTQELYREEASWAPFRRALRREDRELLDELFAAARYHTSACASAGRAVPFESILVSMLVEERRALRELEKKLQEIVSKLAGDTLPLRPPADQECPPER
jgi:hypothetical protein